MDIEVKAPLTGDRADTSVHVYRISNANKVVFAVTGTLQLCIAGWLGAGLFVPHLRAEFEHSGMSSTVNLVALLVLLGLALFSMIRPFQMGVSIRDSEVEVTGSFSSQTIPFAEISCLRSAKDGMYLYRRSKSRVYVRETMLLRDDFYERWKASIYDLDVADRVKRKAEGKDRAMDWFAINDHEQHSAIGGPEKAA